MIPHEVTEIAKSWTKEGWALVEAQYDGCFALTWPDPNNAPDIAAPFYSFDGTSAREIIPLSDKWFSLIPEE